MVLSGRDSWCYRSSYIVLYVHGGPKKRGQRVSLQIFWKLHDRIAWKYCEYLLAYLLIIVSFDDVTLDVIVLFIFGLTLPETLCVTCSVTMWLSLSQMCGHQTVRTWIRWITLFGGHFNSWFTNIEASRLSPNWSRQSLMLGSNCRSCLLTEASTNGVVALSAWYSKMGAISNICLA